MKTIRNDDGSEVSVAETQAEFDTLMQTHRPVGWHPEEPICVDPADHAPQEGAVILVDSPRPPRQKWKCHIYGHDHTGAAYVTLFGAAERPGLLRRIFQRLLLGSKWERDNT